MYIYIYNNIMFIIFIHFPLEEWSIVGFSGWSRGIPAMSFRNTTRCHGISFWLRLPMASHGHIGLQQMLAKLHETSDCKPKRRSIQWLCLMILMISQKTFKRKHQAPWVNVLRHHAHECDTGQTVHTSIHEGTVEFQLFVTGNGILQRIFGSSTCLKDFKTVKCL